MSRISTPRAVLEERHVLLGEDLGDDPLVAVAAGHLVADRDDPLGGDVDLDHLEHAGGELVAALQAVEPPLLLVLEGLDPRRVLANDVLGLGRGFGAAEVERLELEPFALLDQVLGILGAAQRLAGGRVGHGSADDFLQGLDHLLVLVGDPHVLAALGVLELLLEGLALLLAEAHPAAEPLGVDDDPLDARGDLERVVLDVLAGAAEDRVQQLLFGRQLALALGRHLADQDVARLDVGADLDDAVIVEVPQRLLRDVGDVAGELLAAQLGLADLDLELLDVDRGVDVVPHQLLADDDRVLEVVAVPGHEGDQDVAAQGELALVGRGTVGQDLALLDLLAHLDDRLLVQAGPLVQADVLPQLVDVVVVDDHPGRVDVGDRAVLRRLDDHARVDRHGPLQPGGDDRRLGHQQRHRLALHVRAHQRAVGVVVLEERDQAGRDADHLLGRDVHVLDLIDGNGDEVGLVPRGQGRPLELAVVVHDRVGRRQVGLALLVGPHPDDFLALLAVLDLAVRRDEEAVLVDAAVDAQRADQADVGAFRRLDRADPAVVRDVDVADLEAGSLAVQAARPQGREPPLVGELGQRVGLVDDLRQLAAAEEVLDRRADALGVDQRPRRHVVGVLQAHPLLHGAAELEEPLAQLVGGQLVDGPQPAVAQVVDVVDVDPCSCRGAAAGCTGWR